MVLVLEVSAHILTIQAALSEPRSIIATDFCKELPYVVWSFRLHKDFTISGRSSLPPLSTFQDHGIVSAHRSRRDMLVERSQTSVREAEKTHSPHELTVTMPVLKHKR